MDIKINISVAMATFNGDKYLRKQLDSIYNQSILPSEVIVCDDCSSDETQAILEEYKNKFGLKYYINNYNLGFVKNFEKALYLCTGDFIALADQDDIWLPYKLEHQIHEIGENQLLCCNAKIINENGKIIHNSYFDFQNLFPFNQNLFFNLISRNFVTGCTVLLRKDLLRIALPFPPVKYHDQWLGLIAVKNGGMKFIDEKLLCYRQHSKNQVGPLRFKGFKERIANFRQLFTKSNEFNTNEDIIQLLINLLEANINLTIKEKVVVMDIINYFKNRRKYWFNPICVYYGFKYNFILFGYYGSFKKRIFVAFGTLIF